MKKKQVEKEQNNEKQLPRQERHWEKISFSCY